KLPALRQALAGRFRPHHAALLTHVMAHVEYLDEAIARGGIEIDAALRPFAEAMTALDSIPGVRRRTAEVLLAETGGDMAGVPPGGAPGGAGRGCGGGSRRGRGTAAGESLAGAIAGGGRRCLKRPGRPRAPTRRWPPAIVASCAAGATRRPSSPWPPPCSLLPITCFTTARPIARSGRTTTSNAKPPGHGAAPFIRLRRKATASSSNPPPELRGTPGYFPSKIRVWGARPRPRHHP